MLAQCNPKEAPLAPLGALQPTTENEVSCAADKIETAALMHLVGMLKEGLDSIPSSMPSFGGLYYVGNIGAFFSFLHFSAHCMSLILLCIIVTTDLYKMITLTDCCFPVPCSVLCE